MKQTAIQEEKVVIGEGRNAPEKKFRAGALCATVWKNVAQNERGTVEYRTVSFERSYKDRNGAWKSTNSLRINDLPKANLVLQKAYEYLALKGQDTEAVEEEEVVM